MLLLEIANIAGIAGDVGNIRLLLLFDCTHIGVGGTTGDITHRRLQTGNITGIFGDIAGIFGNVAGI